MKDASQLTKVGDEIERALNLQPASPGEFSA
jgi:hypothetical protein